MRVVAVFDGQGDKVSDVSEPGGIQILYSRTGETADDVIEKLVAKYADKNEITVATSDFQEQQTVTSFGALSISALGLKSLVEATQMEGARQLKALKRK